MGSRIIRLDANTIDKIAAGEVIDIPASCVKELIDNAVDAGATDILIEVAIGGRELIRVTDNGCGMNREETLLSIERHATSKLQNIEDLTQLTTSGFRGEALSSIAAISKLTITSAEHRSSSTVCQGTAILVEAGTIHSVQETQTSPGTTIEVSSLFYNVPARRKFLKSPSKDTHHIIKVVTSLALASPHVAFRLIADGRQLLAVAQEQTPPFLNRIRALLGEHFQNNAYEVLYSKEGFYLSGLVVSPLHSRASRSGQYLIVNGRPVQSAPISYAIKTAYGPSCESTKHPLFALHLTLDTDSIDINVHPQKKEIRFADEEWVRMLIQDAVSEALFGKTSFFASQNILTNLSSYPEKEYGATPITTPVESIDTFESSLPLPTQEPTPTGSCLAIIGDIALIQPNHKALCSCSIDQQSLVALDLKQTMRAILFRELDHIHEGLPTEILLVPLTIDCSIEESALLSSELPKLERLGFIIRPFGPQSFLIEGVPSYSPELDIKKFLLRFIHEENLLDAIQAKTKKRLATIYTTAMKSLQHPIQIVSAEAILERWAHSGCPKRAPDGSPCFAMLTAQFLKECIIKEKSSKQESSPCAHTT